MITTQYSLTEIFKASKKAGEMLARFGHKQINKVLKDLAEAAIASAPEILKENNKDLERMQVDDPKYDRLKLTLNRIKDIAGEINNVAALPTPLGKTLEERTMPNGLNIRKITVPIGVIGIIY